MGNNNGSSSSNKHNNYSSNSYNPALNPKLTPVAMSHLLLTEHPEPLTEGREQRVGLEETTGGLGFGV